MKENGEDQSRLDAAISSLWRKVFWTEFQNDPRVPSFSTINWATVGHVGRLEVLNAFYYLIFLLPIGIQLFNDFPVVIEGNSKAVFEGSGEAEASGHVQLSVPNTGQFMWHIRAYFGVICIAIGHVLFYTRSPYIFKKHSSFTELEDHLSITKKVVGNQPSLTVPKLWERASYLRRVSCLLTAFFYGLGAALLLAYAFRGAHLVWAQYWIGG